MEVDKILTDAEFGHIYVRFNARAVNFTFRPANDGTPECGILVTAPRRMDWQQRLTDSVERMRSRLRVMLQRTAQQTWQTEQKEARIDWRFRIESDCLHISLVKGEREGFYLHNENVEVREVSKGNWEVLKPAVMQLICPPDCDFDAEGRQEWLEKVIVEGIRNHAKAQLITRMWSLAQLHGIQLNEVKVNSSKGRWGSCGGPKNGMLGEKSKYNINLSLFTLLLPMSLQQLIMLHELAHTRHMDHSAAFHAELGRWLCGQEEELERRLKTYSTSIFVFNCADCE